MREAIFDILVSKKAGQEEAGGSVLALLEDSSDRTLNKRHRYPAQAIKTG